MQSSKAGATPAPNEVQGNPKAAADQEQPSPSPAAGLGLWYFGIR